MQVIILAGGFGTRLLPLTETKQKVLLPLLNKPIIMHIIEKVKNEEIILAVSYKKEMIEQYFKDKKINIRIIEEKTPLGTGGAIKNVEKYVKDTFLVFNGDVISSLNVKKFLQFHKKKNALGSIALWQVENPNAFGIVELGKEKKILRFKEKPKKEEIFSDLINAGCYVLEKEIFDFIEKDKVVSIEKEVFPFVKNLYGYEFSGYWIDCGTVENYIKAQNILLKEKKKKFVIGKNSVVNGKLKFSSVGENVFVGKGSLILESALMNNVKVGENCEIEKSIVGENCEIENDGKLKSCVVADGVKIKSKEKFENQKIQN